MKKGKKRRKRKEKGLERVNRKNEWGGDESSQLTSHVRVIWTKGNSTQENTKGLSREREGGI